MNLPYWKMVAKGLESDLAASRAECERLRAQRDRMAELVRGASLAFQVDDGDCQQWLDDADAALRDLDKEVQGG